MSSDERKRQRERFLLDRFLERKGITPQKVDQLTPPDPDFIIKIDGRMVGVELTEIFKQFDKSTTHLRETEELLLQTVESFTDQIVSDARRIYFKASNVPVQAKILFSQITRRQNRRDLAELLANKICNMLSEKVDIWSAATDDGPQLLIDGVSRIFICKVREKRFAHWNVMRPGIAANLTPELLQERIDHKAQKLNGYSENKKLEEIWLLLVADRTHPSQMLHHGSDFPSESLSSPFDKTFYYCYPLNEPVVELIRVRDKHSPH